MSYQKLTPITAKGATEPRYLEDRFADVVNVKDFGAIGDGVTEDGEAIENAVAAIANGGTVFFPPGTYLCTQRINLPRQNCVFMGSGSASTKILSNGAQAILSADEEQGFANSNLSFFGLTFDGNTFATGSYSAALVRLYACSDIKFHDCVFQNSSGYGLGIQCRAWDSYAEYDLPRYGVAKNIWIDSCAFINNGWSIEGEDTHDGLDIKFGINVNVSNCLFKENRDCGLDIRASGLNVTNCTSVENTSYGYRFQFEDCGELLEDAQVSSIFNISNLYSYNDSQSMAFLQSIIGNYYDCMINVNNIVLHDVKSRGVYINIPNGSINISNIHINQNSDTSSNRRGIDIITAKSVNITNAILDGFAYGVVRLRDGDDLTTIRNQKISTNIKNIIMKNTSVCDFTLHMCDGCISGYTASTVKGFSLYESIIQATDCDFSNVSSVGTFGDNSSIDMRLPSAQSISWPTSECLISSGKYDGINAINLNNTVHIRRNGGAVRPVTDAEQKLGDSNRRWNGVYAVDVFASTGHITNKLYYGDVYLDEARVTSLLSLLNN